MLNFSRFFPSFAKKMTTAEVLRELYGGREVKSGIVVTAKTALYVTTVWRCTCILADCISTIPLHIYQKNGNTRELATDHPLYELFDCAPNPFQDSLQFRETIGFHLAMTGNAFVFINRLQSGKIIELIPIEPNRVAVKQNEDFSITYTVQTAKGSVEYPQKTIWHIRGPAWNGWMGLETIDLGKEAVGLASALEASHANLHKNGIRSSGVYSVDGTLNAKQNEELRKYLTAELAGVDNTGMPIILDRAAKFLQLSQTGVDAQHLETRNHQIEEICRLFGVLPIMVGYSDKTATYASAEQMFLAHAVHTARPLHRRIEASIKRNLLTAKDRRDGIYPKFVDTELLRGAAKDRAEYYAKGIASGWLTRNEVREWEELNPINGLSEPLSPLNMTVGNPPDPTLAKPTPVAEKPKGDE